MNSDLEAFKTKRFSVNHLDASDKPFCIVVCRWSGLSLPKLEKGFQKKTIVAFTNSTVFILDFNI